MLLFLFSYYASRRVTSLVPGCGFGDKAIMTEEQETASTVVCMTKMLVLQVHGAKPFRRFD